MADGVEHSAHLPLAAFMNDDLDIGRVVVGEMLDEAHAVSGRGAAVVELDPSGEARKRLGRRLAAHSRQIVLLDMIARMGQMVDERAVVGQEHQSFAVRVQSADRLERGLAGQVNQFDDGLLRVPVGDGAGDAARLIERDVGAARGHRRDSPSVHRDALMDGSACVPSSSTT